jgi:hypothetical protein
MGLSHRRMAPCDRQSQKAYARYRAEGQTRNISKSRGSRHRTLSMLKSRCDLGIRLPATLASGDCISATSEFAMAAMHHAWR